MPGQRSNGVPVVVLAAAFLLLAFLCAHLGPERILSLLAALGGNFVVIVLLFGCHECVRATALGRCFRQGERPAFRHRLRVRLLGEAVGALTRTGAFTAEPARAVLMAGQTGLGSGAYAATISELIANSSVSAMVTIAVAGFVLVAGVPGSGPLHGPIRALSYVLWWSSLVYLSAVIAALVTRVHLVGAVMRGIGRLPFVGRWLRPDPERVRPVEEAVLAILGRRSWTRAQIVLLELLAQSILIVEIYWAVHSMAVAIDPAHALFVEVLMKAPNLIQFMGVTEGGYAVIFNWLGMSAAVGFTLSLVKLLRSLVTAALGLGILNRLQRLEPMLPARLRWNAESDIENDMVESREVA